MDTRAYKLNVLVRKYKDGIAKEERDPYKFFAPNTKTCDHMLCKIEIQDIIANYVDRDIDLESYARKGQPMCIVEVPEEMKNYTISCYKNALPFVKDNIGYLYSIKEKLKLVVVWDPNEMRSLRIQ